MAPKDKVNFAFRTPWNLYQFTRVPFGLHGVATSFQRLMDRILSVHRECITVYIDDIVIFSEAWDQHVSHVESILEELRWNGLMANPKKCTLGQTETRYLGLKVGCGRIAPLGDKMEVIQTYQQPQTKKQLRVFLGFINYDRRFIPWFSELASLLTSLLQGKKEGWVEWSLEIQETHKGKNGNMQAPRCICPKHSDYVQMPRPSH